MTLNKWNQFKQFMMAQNKKPDEEKLIHIASLMRSKHNLIIQREPILLFDKDTCKLVKISTDEITKEEYYHHIIHVPDLLFYINDEMWIMEIDGYIHNHKNIVIEKDKMRNEHYILSGVKHIIINEIQILHNQGIHEERSATVDEIWEAINGKLKKL